MRCLSCNFLTGELTTQNENQPWKTKQNNTNQKSQTGAVGRQQGRPQLMLWHARAAVLLLHGHSCAQQSRINQGSASSTQGTSVGNANVAPKLLKSYQNHALHRYLMVKNHSMLWVGEGAPKVT